MPRTHEQVQRNREKEGVNADDNVAVEDEQKEIVLAHQFRAYIDDDVSSFWMSPHLESYNHFLTVEMAALLRQLGPVIFTSPNGKHVCRAWFGGQQGDKVYLSKPSWEDNETRYLTPYEARLRGLDYASTLFVDVEIESTYVLAPGDLPRDLRADIVESWQREGRDMGSFSLQEQEQIGEKEEDEGKDEEDKDDSDSNSDSDSDSVHGNNDTLSIQLSPQLSRELQEAWRATFHEQGKSVVEQRYRTTLSQVPLGALPIMLHSVGCALHGIPKEMRYHMGECPNDFGGTFILRGEERYLPLRFERRKERYTIAKNDDDEGLDVCALETTARFPLCTVFRALGVLQDREIAAYFPNDELDTLHATFLAGHRSRSKGMVSAAMLDAWFGDLTLVQRRYALAARCRDFIEGKEGKERVNTKEKVETPGMMLARYLRPEWQKMKDQWHRSLLQQWHLNPRRYDDRLHALWLDHYQDFVVDTPFREFIRTHSLPMRSPVDLRVIHDNHDNDNNDNNDLPSSEMLRLTGFVDPVDGCSLAVGARITVGIREADMVTWLVTVGGMTLLEQCLSPRTVFSSTSCSLVKVNDVLVGVHADAMLLQSRFRVAKAMDHVPAYVTLSWSPLEATLTLACDAGRLVRPLYFGTPSAASEWRRSFCETMRGPTVVRSPSMYHHAVTCDASLTLFKTPSHVTMEFVDVAMSRHLLIGFDGNQQKHATHREWHPATWMGMRSATIPLLHHCPHPFTTTTTTTKGEVVPVWWNVRARDRFATRTTLDYSETPLLQTVFTSLLPLVAENGMHVVLAIAATGYGMVVHEGAVHRGLFRRTVYEHVVSSEEAIVGPLAPVTASRSTQLIPSVSTEALDPDTGVAKMHARVGGNDVVISQYYEKEQNEVDASLTKPNVHVKSNVDAVSLLQGRAQVRLSRAQLLRAGDRLVSRMGAFQGVVGRVMRTQDMPYLASGVIPDIVLDPTQFSVAEAMEMLLGKEAAQAGMAIDGTVFGASRVGACGRQLVSYGLHSSGNERMYNAASQAMEAMVFSGNLFLQQPDVETKANEEKEDKEEHGAVGMDERAVLKLAAHGMTATIVERPRDDLVEVSIDPVSGCIDARQKTPNKVRLPRHLLLLCHELGAMNVQTRFVTDEAINQVQSLLPERRASKEEETNLQPKTDKVNRKEGDDEEHVEEHIEEHVEEHDKEHDEEPVEEHDKEHVEEHVEEHDEEHDDGGQKGGRNKPKDKEPKDKDPKDKEPKDKEPKGQKEKETKKTKKQVWEAGHTVLFAGSTKLGFPADHPWVIRHVGDKFVTIVTRHDTIPQDKWVQVVDDDDIYRLDAKTKDQLMQWQKEHAKEEDALTAALGPQVAATKPCVPDIHIKIVNGPDYSSSSKTDTTEAAAAGTTGTGGHMPMSSSPLLLSKPVVAKEPSVTDIDFNKLVIKKVS